MADDAEIVKTIARIRKLLADGYKLSEISKLTGWSVSRLWKLKTNYVAPNCVNGYREKTSLSLNDLDLRKSKLLCRRCGEVARLVCKSNLCVFCELVELAKIGLVVIDEVEIKRS